MRPLATPSTVRVPPQVHGQVVTGEEQRPRRGRGGVAQGQTVSGLHAVVIRRRTILEVVEGQRTGLEPVEVRRRAVKRVKSG